MKILRSTGQIIENHVSCRNPVKSGSWLLHLLSNLLSRSAWACALAPVAPMSRILPSTSGGSKGSVNLGDIWPMGVRRSGYDQ